MLHVRRARKANERLMGKKKGVLEGGEDGVCCVRARFCRYFTMIPSLYVQHCAVSSHSLLTTLGRYVCSVQGGLLI
jgi:hypothetical protein